MARRRDPAQVPTVTEGSGKQNDPYVLPITETIGGGVGVLLKKEEMKRAYLRHK